MGEEESRAWNRELTNLSLNISKYPRDLLRGFTSEAIHGGEATDGGGEGEDESAIELNLGLSLGGRFGVDKTPRKLKRSSSVLGTVPFENSTAATEPANYTVGLARTTSLPAEMEEEWRKRKEMQSLRRMEAKRRRCEKLRAVHSDDQTVSSQSRILQSHTVDSNAIGGGSSSSLSELDNKNHQGSSNSYGDERRCSSNTGSNGTEKPCIVDDDTVDKKGKGMMISTGLLDMPCVFTKGDGPNGRRVDGILYKYGGKGEEVRIMCICHGTFLTPAEFVKHGGGGDVDRPLRHIVVNTSPSTF